MLNINIKEIIPVIHVVNKRQTKIEIQKILNCGLNKCFLISHGNLNCKQLIKLTQDLKQIHVDLWIGLNFLDIEESIFPNFLPNNIDAIWIDNSYIGINKKNSEALIKSWKESNFSGIYFGGIAFKYCKQPENLLEATKEACKAMDIITTSGLSTGMAPDLNKIKTMKEIIGLKSLALASGVNKNNIKDFFPYVDKFLVASSIEDSFGNISEQKLNILIKSFFEVRTSYE